MQRFSRDRALKWAFHAREAQNSKLKMRPPIEPRLSDVQTPENHPLWQFFDSKRQYIRKATELEDIGEAWSISQLRRKGFDDLHTLWYVCLKEVNRLNREMRLLALYENRPSADTRKYEADENKFAEVASKVSTTMWRIRHVLAERYHGYQRAKTFELQNEFPRLLEEFRQRYLEADANADGQVNAELERFQFAFFGINPMLETNFPEPHVVRGLYVVADLKLTRYASDQEHVTDVRDMREAYTLFTVEPSPEGVAQAVQTILEVRKTEPVPRSQDVEVLAELTHATRRSVSE